jgi:hypothetical protein
MFSRLKEMVTEFVDAPRGRKSVVGKKEDQDTRRADEDRKKREEDEKRAQEEQNRRERANSSMEITEYDDFQPRRSSLTHRTVVRAGDVDPRSPEPNSKERFVSFERLEKYWGFNPLRVTGDFLNFTDDLLADAFDDVEKLLVKKLPLVDRSEIKKIVDQFYHEAQERNKKNGDLMECYLLRNVFGVPEDRIRVFESGMKDVRLKHFQYSTMCIEHDFCSNHPFLCSGRSFLSRENRKEISMPKARGCAERLNLRWQNHDVSFSSCRLLNCKTRC